MSDLHAALVLLAAVMATGILSMLAVGTAALLACKHLAACRDHSAERLSAFAQQAMSAAMAASDDWRTVRRGELEMKAIEAQLADLRAEKAAMLGKVPRDSMTPPRRAPRIPEQDDPATITVKTTSDSTLDD